MNLPGVSDLTNSGKITSGIAKGGNLKQGDKKFNFNFGAKFGDNSTGFLLNWKTILLIVLALIVFYFVYRKVWK